MYNSREIKVTERKQNTKDPFKKDMIYDPKGQWAHPGENTRIPGGNITMQGVPYPVYGVPYADGTKGQGVMMQPGQDYNFQGADYVDEFPQGFHKMPDGSMMSDSEMDYQDMELSDEEIQQYRDGGYVVEELPTAQGGGEAQWKQNPDGSWTQMGPDYVAPPAKVSPLVQRQMDIKAGKIKEPAPKQPVVNKELPKSETIQNVAQQYIGGPDLKTISDQYMIKQQQDAEKKEAVAQHHYAKMYEEFPGYTIEQARAAVNAPGKNSTLGKLFGVNDKIGSFAWEDYYNKERLWEQNAPDEMKGINPWDPRSNHISFGAPENPTFGDYAGRAWDMVTNPIAAFDYSVRTGDVSNMPWNYNDMMDDGIDPSASGTNPLISMNSMVNPLKIGDNLVRSDNPAEFALNALAFTPYVGPTARAFSKASKTIVPNVTKTWQTHRPVTKLKHLNQYNIDKQLGERLAGNTGQFNEGVYGLKKFPKDLVKFEKPEDIGIKQMMDQYKSVNLADRMKNIPETNIAKVKRQIDFPSEGRVTLETPRVGQRALIMNKLEGTMPNKLSLDDYFAMEPEAIQGFYNDLNLLKNEKLGYDFVGQNYMFDPAKQQFNIFDVIPHQPIKKFSSNTNFWQDEVFGGGNPYVHGEAKATSNIKKSLQERLHFDVGEAARKAGIVSDDYDDIRRMWQDKMDMSLEGLQDGGFIDTEMSSQEIAALRANGYQIDEL